MTELVLSALQGPPPVRRAWYLAAPARRVGRPLAVVVDDTPLVLFRHASGYTALLDRCPHRGTPLSLGRVRDGELECAYHGWRFGADGTCTRVPARTEHQPARAHAAESRPVIEQQGFVWVCPDPEAPSEAPPRFPRLDDQRYAHGVYEATMPAGLLATAENILDVPHTAFLHAGLFRKPPQRAISAKVRRTPTMTEARFEGEETPGGVLGRALLRSDRPIAHSDRFRLPSVAEVEYALGPDIHLMITSALTPVQRRVTRVTAVASLRLKWGARIALALLGPLARWVLWQDQRILGAMTRNLDRFPEQRGTSTEVDLLGPHIARLLRDAGRGQASPEFEREVEMRA